MDAIFTLFIVATLDEGSNLWTGASIGASVGDGWDGENARSRANRRLGLRNPTIDARRTVEIHRHEAKQEIAPRALFHDAERQSCHFNDLTESQM
jgi:hypothetical protein